MKRAPVWSQNPSSAVLRRGSDVLVWWLTWKKNTDSSLSLALLASLAQYRWTSNDLPGVICVTIEATWVLFNVLRWIVDEVGEVWTKMMFAFWPLDGAKTPRPKHKYLEVENLKYWEIREIWGRSKHRSSKQHQITHLKMFYHLFTRCLHKSISD